MMYRHEKKLEKLMMCSRSGGSSQCRVALLPFQASQPAFEAQTSMRSSVAVEMM